MSILFIIPPENKVWGVGILFSGCLWFRLCFRSISWEWIDGILPNFAYALILTRSRLGLLSVNFHQIVTELWPLMIHDFCQNFVSTQYLENELMEFDQILHMHCYWQDLGWENTRQFSSDSNRVMALDDWWYLSEFCFRSISWEWIYGIWPNFAYALILTRSRLGLLCIHFCKFITELWPLIDVRISFPLNILRTSWWNLTKFCIYIDIINIYISIVTHQFSKINNSVMVLDWCQNFVSAQYLDNKLMEFDQILHMHWYWQDLG